MVIFYSHKDTKAQSFIKLNHSFYAPCVFLVSWCLSGRIVTINYLNEFLNSL